MFFLCWDVIAHHIVNLISMAFCFFPGSLPQQQSLCQNHHGADCEPPVQRRQQVRRGDPPQTINVCTSATAFLLIGILTGDLVPALPVDWPPSGGYCDSAADARHRTVVPRRDVRLLLSDAGSNIVRTLVLQAEVLSLIWFM